MKTTATRSPSSSISIRLHVPPLSSLRVLRFYLGERRRRSFLILATRRRERSSPCFRTMLCLVWSSLSLRRSMRIYSTAYRSITLTTRGSRRTFAPTVLRTRGQNEYSTSSSLFLLSSLRYRSSLLPRRFFLLKEARLLFFTIASGRADGRFASSSSGRCFSTITAIRNDRREI